MDDRLKEMLKILTPPILWDLVSRFVWRFRERQPVKPGEKSAEWYDEYYSQFRGEGRDYTGSEYYFLWAVIADRLLRVGFNRPLKSAAAGGGWLPCFATRVSETT